MKIKLSEFDNLLKICVGVLGLTLFCFGFYQLSKPQLDDYPKLDSCFKTSVHKILLCDKNPNYVRLGEISDNLVRAILMSEDDKFFDHEGVDWVEIKISLRKNLSEGRFARGGSTITQQLVKNAYLSQKKSLIRKLKEFFLAREIEKKYSKALILEKYLNLIELGDDLYGLKRASQFYFKKPVSQLKILEAMYLVTLLPNPKRLSKSFFKKKLTPGQIKKIKILLQRSQRRGHIEKPQYHALVSQISSFPWKNGFINANSQVKNLNFDNLNNNETFTDKTDNKEDFDNNISNGPSKQADIQDESSEMANRFESKTPSQKPKVNTDLNKPSSNAKKEVIKSKTLRFSESSEPSSPKKNGNFETETKSESEFDEMETLQKESESESESESEFDTEPREEVQGF